MTNEPELLPPLPDADFRRVLCVVAHPDDLEYGASGAVGVWTSRGVEVTYLLITRGEAGMDAKTPEEARAIRTDDERRAAETVGVSAVEFLDRADGTLEYSLDLRRDIAREVRRRQPDVVLTSSWDLANPWGLNQADHRVAGLTTLDAVRDAGNRWVFPELLREGLQPWSARWLLVFGDRQPTHGVVLDDAALQRAVASLAAHAGYLAGIPGHPPAEEFVPMVTAGMGKLMGVEHAAVFTRWDLGGPGAH